MRLIGLALGIIMMLGADARAGAAQDCAQFESPALRVSGCTALIEAGAFENRVMARIYNNRGVAHGVLGDRAQAVADFTEAVRLDPGYPEAYSNRGDAHGAVGRYAEALADYKRVTELVPDHPWAYYSRALIYDLMGDWEKSVGEYDQALRLSPDQGFMYALRGSAHQNRGAHERAVADWVRSVELGGTAEATGWQEYLTKRGYFSGAVNGILDSALREAMMECARDPKC
jgi:tetratricopeptide (TPR) repeat protein